MTLPKPDEAAPEGAAKIVKDFTIKTPVEAVWDALRDFGALPTRLVAGFVTSCRLEGRGRIVGFANGSEAREELVDWSDVERRVVYAILPNERIAWHRASATVSDAGHGQTRFVWVCELLPAALAPYVDGQMDLGAAAMRRTLEGKAAGNVP